MASTFGIDTLPKISHGKGSYLFDTTGKRYIDGSGGPAVYCIGHANEEVNEAIKAQLDKVAHGYRYFFTSDPLEELTEMISRLTDGHFTNMLFNGSGSEAVESCLKIALQYHWARGKPQKSRFISRERSWHGNTMGALSVSGFGFRRAPHEKALVQQSFVSPANSYRPAAGLNSGDLVAHLAAELENRILEVGADTIAAFIFEPVVGAAGGVVPAPEGYAQAMIDVCHRHDILVIADEVMCGAGRCGTWRALAHDGVVPDLMTVAKGLGGGYMPLGGSLFSDEIAATIYENGGPRTGHTFTGHTAACAGALTVQKIIERDGLVERVKTRGKSLLSELSAALQDIEIVGDVRGRGFFLGVELVADRETKEPFPAARALSTDIGRRAWELGLICYPSSGNVDGEKGDTVILAPPYNATDSELEEIIELLRQAVDSACRST